MFKRLGMIGLAVAITLAVASSAMADLKFYGGDMVGNIVIRPDQGLQVISGAPGGSAIGDQGLTDADSMTIATSSMYGVAADNEFLFRNVSGLLGKDISERQVTAAHNKQDTYCLDAFYKSSGLQTTVGSFAVASSDKVQLNGNLGNIQFDAQGADPTLVFNEVSQITTDTGPTVGPSMTQTNNVTATLASPGAAANTPLSMITTGNATGLVTITSGIGTSTLQNQEFSSLLKDCQGLYNGQMMKKDTIDMGSTTMMGTGSIVIAP